MSSPWATSHAEGHMCARLPEGCGKRGGPKALRTYMVVSQNEGPQYRPSYTIVLLIGTPKMVTLILGNLYILRLSGQKTILSRLWGDFGP